MTSQDKFRMSASFCSFHQEKTRLGEVAAKHTFVDAILQKAHRDGICSLETYVHQDLQERTVHIRINSRSISDAWLASPVRCEIKWASQLVVMMVRPELSLPRRRGRSRNSWFWCHAEAAWFVFFSAKATIRYLYILGKLKPERSGKNKRRQH